MISLIVLFTGCYKDLGNYDYVDINEFSIDILPKAQEYNEEYFSYSYVYRQPANDAFEVTYTPEITQTQNQDDSKIEFEWVVVKNGNRTNKDTISTKELTLTFEPKVKTTYNVVLKVTDRSNDIQKYRELNIRTQLPFVKSWFVLHGNEGERRLGVVDQPDNEAEVEVLNDVYQTIHDKPNPFANVTDMYYTAADGANFNEQEHMVLLEPTEAHYIHPFNMNISLGYNIMIPNPSAKPKLAYGVSNNFIGRYAVIVSEDGKFFHGGPGGIYYMTETLPEVSNYHVDNIYIASNSLAIIWDNNAKRFMYYMLGDNYYGWPDGKGRPSGVYVGSTLTPMPQELFLANELINKEVLWIGPPYDSSTEAGASVILRDNDTGENLLYHFNFDESYDSIITIDKKNISNVIMDNNSLFAMSVAFSYQFFYTLDDTLYHYSIVTEENTAIYTLSPGEEFTQLKFREPYSHYMVENENHKLGIGVLKNGSIGELHEISFSQAGDVIGQKVFSNGFGPIKNIEYTFIHRIIR